MEGRREEEEEEEEEEEITKENFLLNVQNDSRVDGVSGRCGRKVCGCGWGGAEGDECGWCW